VGFLADSVLVTGVGAPKGEVSKVSVHRSALALLVGGGAFGGKFHLGSFRFRFVSRFSISHAFSIVVSIET